MIRLENAKNSALTMFTITFSSQTAMLSLRKIFSLLKHQKYRNYSSDLAKYKEIYGKAENIGINRNNRDSLSYLANYWSKGFDFDILCTHVMNHRKRNVTVTFNISKCTKS